MGIKEFLESGQTQITREFVSVKTLVQTLAEDQVCSKSDVAKFLLVNMDRLGKDKPDLLSVDLEFLRIDKEVCADPLWPLREVVSADSLDDDLNLYGWRRDEIFRFLKECELYPLQIIPEWSAAQIRDADNPIEDSEMRRERLRKAVAEIRASENISISKAFDRLAGGEFGGRSNISNMFYPRKK